MGGGSLRAVYIEDEPDLIDLVKMILSRKGIEVIGAVAGREGLETVQREQPDVVLLDLMIPDMDGWEVYRRLRTDHANRKTPVVVVSALNQEIDRLVGVRLAGVDEYLTKPFNSRELLECVERAIAKKQELSN